ncbi:MAG: Uma2 family endonuclease [Gemmataceae bacterium]|nr:Uma2 family endonuclease [Gemmataceae bacterium]
MPGGEHYELIDGVPREKPMGAESDEIGGLLLTQLNNYIRPKKLGRAYPSQTGFQCFPQKPKLVRMPDTAFVAAGRLPNDRTPEGDITVAPDIAVEVISPNETYEEVEAKVAEYGSAVVKQVWVVSPKSKTVLVRRLDKTRAELDETGALSGEDVLPGFACAVADLFV